ncbi:MAG: Fur family transcriptional regulator [Candidatus Moranbacteria bacterium]|nr:Fur family transcriptional regulator [Candidatus Moranbacteria bacterium]
MKENDILNLLVTKGLRLTKTRRALVSFFLEEAPPLSATHILEKLRCLGRGVNKTTVYRELERLEKIGIVRSVWFRERKQYYELAHRDHHHHFVCTMCDAITDIVINELNILTKARQLGQQIGFSVTAHMMEFYGQCAACRKVLLYRQSV